MSLRGAPSATLRINSGDEAISFSPKDCFAPLAMTWYRGFADTRLTSSWRNADHPWVGRAVSSRYSSSFTTTALAVCLLNPPIELLHKISRRCFEWHPLQCVHRLVEQSEFSATDYTGPNVLLRRLTFGARQLALKVARKQVHSVFAVCHLYLPLQIRAQEFFHDLSTTVQARPYRSHRKAPQLRNLFVGQMLRVI